MCVPVDQKYEGVSREQLIEMTATASRKLLDAIDSASVLECMEKTDEAGWNCRDHLAHVNAYQWSAIYPLQGRTRADAFGVTEKQAVLPFDELNELIRAKTRDQPLELTVKDAIDTNKALEEMLRTIDMNELWRLTSEVAPDVLSFLPDQPYINVFMYCSVDHYDVHRAYIEKILAS